MLHDCHCHQVVSVAMCSWGRYGHVVLCEATYALHKNAEMMNRVGIKLDNMTSHITNVNKAINDLEIYGSPYQGYMHGLKKKWLFTSTVHLPWPGKQTN